MKRINIFSQLLNEQSLLILLFNYIHATIIQTHLKGCSRAFLQYSIRLILQNPLNLL